SILPGIYPVVKSTKPSAVPSFGIAERLSFDTLTVWTVAVGVAVLAGRGLTDSRREHTESGGHH
ncbi:hypothetical protein M3F61_13530, partial [Brevibacterium casei]|nr:hypothetical protein [Brevibacterium casei]